MKANKLMIGDFFLYKEKAVEVVSIDGGTETVWIDGKKVSALRKIDDLQPIPLTPEILEKNNFTKDGMFGKTYYLAVEDFEISIYFAHVNTQLIIEKRNGSKIINILNIEYLHILQHALKLCGIDKTIEL